MMIRRVLDDVGLDLSYRDGVEVRAAAAPLDIDPWAAHEVLLVSADPERLVAAGALGLNRLVAAGPDVMAATVDELCRELDRP